MKKKLYLCGVNVIKLKYSVFTDMNKCSALMVEQLMRSVSPQRCEQAMRYSHIYGQFCCLKSYTMLMQLLDKNNDSIEQYPEFKYNAYGQPQLPDGPYFSISHCKSGIAVAIAPWPVGIDIEVVRPLKHELVRKTMNDEEQKWIFSHPSPQWAFTRLWTQKEAYLKMKGTGIISSLHDVLTDVSDVHFVCKDNIDFNYALSIAYL